jgi:hypothetical protein
MMQTPSGILAIIGPPSRLTLVPALTTLSVAQSSCTPRAGAQARQEGLSQIDQSIISMRLSVEQ